MNLRDVILAARDLEMEVVEVEAWKCAVGVSVMGGATRERLMESLRTPAPASVFQATMLAATLVDPETGAPIFGESDVEALRAKNPDVMQMLVATAMKLNGLGQNAVEEEVKNSEAVQN
jgi:hypothetical protein